MKGTSYINDTTTKSNKSQLKIESKSVKIKSKISGALDKFYLEADKHAKIYYESIRNRQDDAYFSKKVQQWLWNLKDKLTKKPYGICTG